LLQAAAAVFQYPMPPARRRHGPRGYVDFQSYKPWLRDEFDCRCVYCLCRERWVPNGADGFSVEHVDPQSTHPRRAGDYGNLIYACCTCNASRADAALPLDPSRASLGNHIQLETRGTVRPLTTEGAVVIDICRLNRPSLVSFRRRLLRVIAVLAAQEDPRLKGALEDILSFPDDLPNLASRRPPGGNARPQGIAESCFERRRKGVLPGFY
jgi:hypothetical protein